MDKPTPFVKAWESKAKALKDAMRNRDHITALRGLDILYGGQFVPAGGRTKVFASGDDWRHQYHGTATFEERENFRIMARDDLNDALGEIVDTPRQIRGVKTRISNVERYLGTGPAAPTVPSLRDRVANRTFSAGGGRPSMNMGPIRVGSKGLSFNRSFMRGMDVAFRVGIGAHLVGAALTGVADTVDKIKVMQSRGYTQNEQAEVFARGAAGTVAKVFGGATGADSLASGLLRMFGFDKEDAARAPSVFYDMMIESSKERKERLAAIFDTYQKGKEEADKWVMQKQGKIAAYRPKTFRTKTHAGAARYHAEMESINESQLRFDKGALYTALGKAKKKALADAGHYEGG